MFVRMLAKDLRQTMWPLLLAASVLLAPLLIGAIVAGTDGRPWPSARELRRDASELLIAGTAATVVAASAISGVAFAKERRERTIEMLYTLPVSRPAVVASKWLVVMIVTGAPIALGLVLSRLVAGSDGDAFYTDQQAMRPVYALAACWWMLLGLGWCLSSVLRSEVLSAAVPFLLTVALVGLLAIWQANERLADYNGERSERLFIARLVWSAASIGTAGFLAGTLLALFRRRP